MKKVLFILLPLFLASCSQDPARYDVNSPCVAIDANFMVDAPCQTRLPLENYQFVGKIAHS